MSKSHVKQNLFHFFNNTTQKNFIKNIVHTQTTHSLHYSWKELFRKAVKMGQTFSLPYPHPKSWIFKPSTIKKHYEIWPLLAIVIADMLYVGFNVIWMPVTRDISLEPSKFPNNMRMDLLHPHWLKLIVINDKLFPRPEMHEAYEMMRDGEKKEYEEVKKAIQEKSKNRRN
ncbi:uncharacterized protein [Rhodnius prolixus]|uniref:uncharacterized protein n=1 Tax=Rhodnius prolixus TaxID=13249 RepID=UPI003D189A5A